MIKLFVDFPFDYLKILFSFVTGEHGDCPSFNNYLGDDVYAHATYPEHGGDAHFDENQPWTINSNKGKSHFK
jgi:matrix metalloproteinase-14 (membrane-inserted)